MSNTWKVSGNHLSIIPVLFEIVVLCLRRNVLTIKAEQTLSTAANGGANGICSMLRTVLPFFALRLLHVHSRQKRYVRGCISQIPL
jgi:hypothetical protein